MRTHPSEESSCQLFVVQASAGSGKTYALATRYLRLLLSSPPELAPEALRSILAITFTNKAAVQMKERILFFLKKIAFDRFRDPAEKAEILGSVSPGSRDPAAQARSALESIIKEYNYFQVQTIDSFINAILSGCSFRLDLSAHFKIKPRFQQYLALGIDRFIERAHARKELKSLLEDYVQQFLFLEHKSGWFPRNDLQEMLGRLFDDSNLYGAAFREGGSPSRSDLYRLRSRIFASISELLSHEPAGANQTAWKAIASRYERLSSDSNVEDIAELFEKDALPMRKGSAVAPAAQRTWDKIRRQITELFELQSESIFDCYVRIFDNVYTELIGSARRDDVVFLNELNRKAQVLLDEKHVTVPELYYRLASRFRHFLIDEFQDTSRLQWHNLHPMVEEALAKGGTLFYVGDKKQAIFRFRGGDVTLFDSIPREFARFEACVSCLNNNYRSYPEIVGFNNEIFAPENLRRFLTAHDGAGQPSGNGPSLLADDIEDVVSVFDGCQQQCCVEPGQGYVEITRFDAATKDESLQNAEAALSAVIDDVSRRMRGTGGIAVLCRTNRQIEMVSSWLLARHIPVESEKTLNIKEHPLIKELVSFLRFLDSPIDDLSFASFVLGDVFSQASGLKRQEVRDLIFGVHQQAVRSQGGGYLYRHFRSAFGRQWDEFIEPFFVSVGSVPLYELVVSICARLRISQNFAEYQGFLMRFLEVVRVQVDEEDASLAVFLEYYDQATADELYVNGALTGAVKVLSIHKAKGLEFPVVILPFFELHAGVSAGNDRPPYLLYPDQDHLRLLRVNKTYAAFSSPLGAIYRAELKLSLIDELNAAYVALTRAQAELYVFIPRKSARSLNEAAKLIPESFTRRGEKLTVFPPGQPDIPAMPLGSAQFRDWVSVLRRDDGDDSSLRYREQIKRGIWVHAALSQLDMVTADSLDAAIRQSLRSAGADLGERKDQEAIRALVHAIVSHPALQGYFFEQPGARVYREKEIVDAEGRTWRIDRLWVGRDRAVVIDFKSSKSPEGQDRSQIANYQALVKQLMPDRKVSAVLVYLDTAEVEEIDG